MRSGAQPAGVARHVERLQRLLDERGNGSRSVERDVTQAGLHVLVIRLPGGGLRVVEFRPPIGGRGWRVRWQRAARLRLPATTQPLQRDRTRAKTLQEDGLR